MSVVPDPRVTRRVLPGLGRAEDARGQASLDGQDPAVQVRQPQHGQLAPPCSCFRGRADQQQRLLGGEQAPGARGRAGPAPERVSGRRDGVTSGGEETAHLVRAVVTPGLGPRRAAHPGQRVQRSRPSATAQDTALRMRSQRADTFGTDTPSPRQRQMAARTTAGVSDCGRQRHSGSPSRPRRGDGAR